MVTEALERWVRWPFLVGLLAGLALLASSLVAVAQPPPSGSIAIRADRTRVDVGVPFRLSISARVVGAAQTRVEPPRFDHFRVLSGSVPQMPMNVFGGGALARRMESSSSSTMVLAAEENGTYTIGPAHLDIDGRRIASNSITIVVGDGVGGDGVGGDGVGGSAPTHGLPTPPEPTPIGDRVDAYEFDAQGFIRTAVDDGTPYVGQQVTITVSLYTPRGLPGQPSFTREPSAEGFWVQDLLSPRRTLTPRSEEMQGHLFQVYELRRFAAFPLEPGETTIGRTELTVRSRPFFSVFGQRGAEPQVYTGPPLSLEVRGLPAAGRPPGEVHVGELSLVSSLDRNTVDQGGAVTLTVTASGRGIMEHVRLGAPTIAGLRILDPEFRDAFGHPNDVVGGSRAMRYLVVPQHGGDFTIPAMQLPFFNPHTEVYGVAQTTALRLSAAGPNAGGATDPTGDPAETDGPDDAAATFGPIHTESAFERSHSGGFLGPWFWAAFFFWPALFVVALIILAVRRRALREDPSRAPKRARKLAKKHLGTARGHAQTDEPRAFYASVAQAITEVIEGQLGHPVGSLTHAELGRTLRERGMQDELADTILEELEGCDFARFSAVGVASSEMERCLERVGGLIASISKFRPTPEEGT